MFSLDMDTDLRHHVLVMMKEKWEAGQRAIGREQLDDVILFEIFSALFDIWFVQYGIFSPSSYLNMFPIFYNMLKLLA